MTQPIPSNLPPVPLPRRVPGAALAEHPEIYEEVLTEFPGFNPDTVAQAKTAAAMVADSYKAVEDRKKRGEPAPQLRDEHGRFAKTGDPDA